ncbi:MAG: glycosyltransferase [Fluviicola sp.]|jgi:glycosyltransferase involved in cell wall biosynthesis
MSESIVNKPKLVVMLSRFPFPLEKGDKLRAYQFIKGLSDDYSIHLICTTDEIVSTESKKELEKYCTEIHIFKLTKLGLFFQLMTDLFFKKPFQVHYFYRSSINKSIQGLLEKIKPDHIFCQLIRVSEYVKHYHHCKKTLDYMDVLSVGMKRRVSVEKWYKRWFFKLEFERVRSYERSIFDYFENKLIISDQDQNLIPHPRNSEIKIVSNGISDLFFEELEVEKEFDLVFVGNLSYAPNVEAAEFLANEILPELHRRGFKLNVLISGASPDKRVLKLESEYVKISGWVEDIRLSYLKGRLFVAPLFIGTGQQNKVLEAMALGVPCLTSSLVFRGLNQFSTQNILLADTFDTFVEKIISVSNNFEYLHVLSTNAKKEIKENYKWTTQISALKSILRS